MNGPAYHVSDAAALAAALGALGVPERAAAGIADSYPGGRGLATATPRQIAAAGGGRWGRPPAWAVRVSAAFCLARVAACQAGDGRTAVANPTRAAARLRRLLGSETAECFAVMLLDARQRVIDVVVVHRGTLAAVDVHPREVLRPAVQCGAHSVIVAHNHPSGDPEPSGADVDLTSRLVDAGRLLGVPVVDHLILTPTAHTSLAAIGVLA